MASCTNTELDCLVVKPPILSTITPGLPSSDTSSVQNQDLKGKLDSKNQYDNNNDNSNDDDDDNNKKGQKWGKWGKWGDHGNSEGSCKDTTVLVIQVVTKTEVETKTILNTQIITQMATVTQVAQAANLTAPTSTTTVVSYQSLAASSLNSTTTITVLPSQMLPGSTVTHFETSVLYPNSTLAATTGKSTLTGQPAASAASTLALSLPKAVSSAPISSATTVAGNKVIVPLSTGSVAGIVIGGLAGFYFATYLIWNFVHRKKPKPIPFRPRPEGKPLEKNPSGTLDMPFYIPASMQHGGVHDQSHLWAKTSNIKSSKGILANARTVPPLPVYQHLRDFNNTVPAPQHQYIQPSNLRVPQERYYPGLQPSDNKNASRTTIQTDDATLSQQSSRGLSENPYYTAPTPEISAWSPATERSIVSPQATRPSQSPSAWFAGNSGVVPPPNQTPGMNMEEDGPPTPWFTGEPGGARSPNPEDSREAEGNTQAERPITEWFPEGGEARNLSGWSRTS